MSVSSKMQEWYISIEAQKFEGIAESIAEVLPKANPKYNKQMDSLLSRLTHAFMKYQELHKDDLKTGLEVYKLTCCLCDRFTEFSNPPRLRSGIYHISRCLKELSLYSESMTICDYAKPGKLITPDPSDFEFFGKLAYAWRQSAEFLIQSLSTKFDQRTYNILLEIIKYDFGLLKFTEENGSYFKLIFVRFQKYINRIHEMNWSQNKIENLFYSILKHLETLLDNSSLEIDSLPCYDGIIEIMHFLSLNYIKKKEIGEVSHVISKFSKELEVFVKKDPQTQKCFELHLSFYKLLVKPVNKFDMSMLEDVCNYRRKFRSRFETFGSSKIMQVNASLIYKVMTPLFSYWLECMKSCSIEYLHEIVYEVGKLMKYVAAVLTVQSIDCRCGLDTCNVKRNHFEEINILQKFGSFIVLFDQKSLSKDFLHFARDFIVEGILKVEEYKVYKCGYYLSLWSNCGQILYNLGSICFQAYPDLSAEMFSNLCSYIIRDEGTKSRNKFLRSPNPLSLVLHKLSIVYFRIEKYREAMIVTAFDGLISYEDEESKAFKMWSGIKHKCDSEEIMKQTMISCLKSDKAAIKEIGVDINVEDYDLAKLCAREIRGLQKSKVNLTPAIKACLKELDYLQNTAMEFVEGVQYLGYHVLYFRDECNISEYVKRAESYLCNYDKSSVRYFCFEANFEFFKFIDRLNATSRKIKNEMKNTKNILKSNKNETKLLDETIESDEVVPVYRLINMKQDADIASHLKQVIVKWENCFKKNPKEILNCWEPQITLDMIIIAGEIARLYLSQFCEKRIWLLAYKLASALDNNAASLYVTARSISLRYVNDLWIEKSLDYAESLKISEETEDKSAVGMFWISLADFYFEKGRQKEAVKLLKDVQNLGTIDFSTDVPVYLDFLDTVIRNYQFYSEEMQHEEYSEYIVHTVYSMITVSEIIGSGGKRTYYGVNTLLDAVNHMSLVMHSFISFREISAHLTFRLELAQSLGATLRVAECLKSLCLIELSRLKLDDCEVKLQGLEQILDVEGFGLSMKNKCPEFSVFRSNTILTSQRMDVDDPLRDLIQNEASPVLRKKIFVPPEFMLHENCNCYRCENIPYQYLVFSSTHIRAQIYALKDYSSVALQHFHGAFEVRRKLLEKEESRIMKESRKSVKLHLWQKYYSMVDYVLFLLDFSKFIIGYKIPRETEAMEIALEAVNICMVYKLETHPVYYAAVELIFQYRFQNLKSEIHGCPVPDVANIDISDILPAETNSKQNEKVKDCLTPSHFGELPLKAIRRKKTPPLLPLTKVAMSLSDSEDEESQPSKISQTKPPRKRILNFDVDRSCEDVVIKSSSRIKSASSKTESTSKNPSASKTTKTPKILIDKHLADKFKNISIEPKSPGSINASLEKLVSKVTKLKSENFQKTPMFAFSEEDLETMKAVLNEKEFQNVIQSIEELKSFNFVLANSSKLSARPSRSRSKLSLPSSEDKSMQTFEKNMCKVVDILQDAVVRRKFSNISISSSKDKSLPKNLNSASSKSKLNGKSSDISRPSSPDLFPSDDESIKITKKESSTTKVRKSTVEVLSVDGAENSDKGKRITRSRSMKMPSDSESVDFNSKKESRIPRKKS